MMNRQPIAAGLVCEVGILGELVVKLCLGGRNLAGRECNAIDQADHALGYGAQIVRHVGGEGDGAKWASPSLVLASPVMLNDQSSALADEKRVQPINLPILLGLSQTLLYFLRWRCCGKGLACRHQSCCQGGEHMAAIDLSLFFLPCASPARSQIAGNSALRTTQAQRRISTTTAGT